MTDDSGPTTIWGALQRAAETGQDCGVTVLDGAGAREFRSWRRIRESAIRVADGLEEVGVEAGQRIVVSLPTSFGFLSTFFGALGVGAVPIPFPIPDYTRHQRLGSGSPIVDAGRALGATGLIVENADDLGASTSTGFLSPFEEVWEVGELRGNGREAFEPAGSGDGRPAYIQVTEGATGRPRGVGLSDAAILANVRAMGRALDAEPDDVGVSWIPLHNALGLVGVLLFGVVHAIDLVFIEPEDFLRRPDIWLRAISRHGGTLSPAPNFAFHYTVRRCKESDLDGLDLSSWRVAMNGGEPVRGQHMDAFLRRFGRYGLGEDVLTPVYGLSEATLGVAFEAPERRFGMDAINRQSLEQKGRAQPLPDSGAPSPAERMHLVSVGRPLPNLEVRILDPENGDVLGARQLGEVAVKGPSVMDGYVDSIESGHDSERGADTELAGEWLRTGDLGYLADGELYVVGRGCDRIRIDRARRVYPEEVELFVDAIDGVHAGRTVAFGLESREGESGVDDEGPGVEQLVVAVELQSGTEPEDVERRTRELLDEHLAVQPETLAFLSPRSIPRTKSGKVRRFLARRMYVAGGLDRRDRNSRLGRIRTAISRVRREVEALGDEVSRRLGEWFS